MDASAGTDVRPTPAYQPRALRVTGLASQWDSKGRALG